MLLNSNKVNAELLNLEHCKIVLFERRFVKLWRVAVRHFRAVGLAWVVRFEMLLTRSELIEKIRLGEDDFLELKEVRFAGTKIRQIS